MNKVVFGPEDATWLSADSFVNFMKVYSSFSGVNPHYYKKVVITGDPIDEAPREQPGEFEEI